MENNKSIIITNKRIVDFFSKHKNLDTDQTILSFIDIMENLSDNMNNQMNNSLVENLLKNMQSINGKIESLDNNITNFKQENISSFTDKMNDFKKDYMESLRLNLTSNVSDKIEPFIKEQMSILLERSTKIINDIIPKNNSSIQESIKKSFSEFNNEINSDTKKLLDNNITRDSLNSFIQTIDSKLSQTITSTEKRLDDRISSVKRNTDGQLDTTNSLNQNVNTLLQKMENSSVKGKLSENILFNNLHSLYPTAQIDHVGQQKETGDIILSRPGKPTILVENKNWNKNVVQDEVKKFIRDTETQKCSGIFLSQNFGIANKDNFEINIHNNNVLVYVHQANNESEKIKIAVDIVDHFKQTIETLNTDTEVDTIPKEKLDAINNEVQFLVSSKLSLINIVKDYNQKMLKQLDEFKIPTLEDFLATKYATSCSKFTCEHCDFIAKNKAALAAHKRRCKHIKNVVIDVN